MVVEYVVGFAFTNNGLVLLRKRKPAHLAGKFCAPGGKVEPGEQALGAMVREFEEETGALTAVSDWDHFASFRGDDSAKMEMPEDRRFGYVVYCYRAFFEELEVRTTTDEPVFVWPIGAWLGHHELNHNLYYLIPMALDPQLNSAALQYISQTAQEQEEKTLVG